MEGLTKNENYWEAVVSDVEEVLWHHNLEMVTSYGTRTSRKVIRKDKVNKIENKENVMVSLCMLFSAHVIVLPNVGISAIKNSSIIFKEV